MDSRSAVHTFIVTYNNLKSTNSLKKNLNSQILAAYFSVTSMYKQKECFLEYNFESIFTAENQ